MGFPKGTTHFKFDVVLCMQFNHEVTTFTNYLDLL